MFMRKVKCVIEREENSTSLLTVDMFLTTAVGIFYGLTAVSLVVLAFFVSLDASTFSSIATLLLGE